MLDVEMLAAGHGDSLLIHYGTPGDVHRILVDGGPYYAYDDPGGLRERLLALLDEGGAHIDLLVVTHVDTDHVEGIIRMLLDPALEELTFGDVWFNGWRHLQGDAPADVLAGKHGEYFGALLLELGLPWNRHPAFQGGPVAMPDDGSPPTLDLPGGATLTLLSPGREDLRRLARDWEKSTRDAGFAPGDADAALEQVKARARYAPPRDTLGTRPDNSAANGSSIAFLLAYGDTCVLLAGDAWPRNLERALKTLDDEGRAPDSVRDFKLSHHGSFGNQSPRLVRLARARRYLISSSGAYFQHPDRDTLRLILAHHDRERGDPEFVFNYLSASTRPWADPDRQESRAYVAAFPTGWVRD